MAVKEDDFQALYDEANRRGLLKVGELQQLSHELRRRGVVKDPTQGGLVVPQPGQKIVVNVTIPGQQPQQPTVAGPAAPGMPNYNAPPLPGAGPAGTQFPAQPQPMPQVGPPPKPKPTQPVRPPFVQPSAVPKLSPMTLMGHPAEQAFWQAQELVKGTMPSKVVTPGRKDEVRRLQQDAIAKLGGALPEIQQQLHSAKVVIDQENQQITAAEAAIGRGYGTPRDREALKRQREALNAKIDLYNGRLTTVQGYEKRWQAFTKTQGERPLHGGLYYDEEPETKFSNPTSPIDHLIAPNAAVAMDEAAHNRRLLMLTGQYPALPPLPPEARTPEQRAALIRRKNSVVDWVTGEFDSYDGQPQNQLLHQMHPEWGKWEFQLLPIVRHQMQAEQTAKDKTSYGRALMADTAAWAASLAAGGVAGRAVTGLAMRALPAAAIKAAPTLTRLVPGIVGGGAAGGAGSAAGAATATLVQGGTPQEAAKAAYRSAPMGMAVGAAAGLAHAAVGETVRAIRGAKTTAEVNGLVADLRKQRLAPPLAEEQLQQLKGHAGTDVLHARRQIADLEARLQAIHDSGDLSRITEARQIGEQIAKAQQRLTRLENEAKARFGRGMTQPPAEEPGAAPAAGGGGAPKPKPVTPAGGGAGAARPTAPTAVAEAPTVQPGPVVTIPDAPPVNLRTTPPHVLTAIAGQIAQSHPEQAQQILTHVDQHRAYDQYVHGTPVPPETREQYGQEWNNVQNPARLQVEVLNKAAGQAQTEEQKQRLQDAAQQVQQQWEMIFRGKVQTGNEMTDAPPAVAPPMVAPWRQMSPAEQDQLSPAVQGPLLVQDIVNSTQVLSPETPGFFTPQGLGVKGRDGLRQMADKLFADAQAHAASQMPAPAAGASIQPAGSTAGTPPQAQPSTSTGLPGMSIKQGDFTIDMNAPEGQQVTETPPITEADLQRGFTWRTPQGYINRLERPNGPREWHTVLVHAPPTSRAKPGARSTFSAADIIEHGQRVDFDEQGNPILTATAPVAPTAEPQLPTDIGRTGAARHQAQQQRVKEALAPVGRTGGPRVKASAEKKAAAEEARKPKVAVGTEWRTAKGTVQRVVAHAGVSSGGEHQYEVELIQPGEGLKAKAGSRVTLPESVVTSGVARHVPQQQPAAETKPETAGLVFEDLRPGMRLRNKQSGEVVKLANGPYYKVVPHVGNTKFWEADAETTTGDALSRVREIYKTNLDRWELAPEAAAEPEARPERRKDTERRKRIEEMSDAEKDAEILAARKEARTDALTGFHNRRAWDELEAEWDTLEPKPFVAYIDADGLSYVNDTWGHAAGDAHIRAFAEALRSAGLGDVTYRYGGDEMIMLLPDVVDLANRADAARKVFEETVVTYPGLDGKDHSYTGVSWSVGFGTNKDDADGELKKAKQARTAEGLRATAKGGRPPGLVELGGEGGAAPAEAEAPLPTPEPQASERHPGAARAEAAGGATAEPVGQPEVATLPAVEGMPEGYGRFIQGLLLDLQAGTQSAKNITDLNTLARKYWGTGIASGVVTPRDIYDALEAAVALHVKDDLPNLQEQSPTEALSMLENLLKLLPTQTVRTTEQVEHQQFSTPPTIAYVAALAAQPRPDDIVLEPSAGTGSLATMVVNMGVPQANVHVNEIAPRRNAILAAEGFQPTDVDAEAINSSLPQDIKPTLIVMNPPFSATGGRVSKHSNKFGFRHVEDALERLQPGGRLVAIMGEGQSPAHPTADAFWDRLKKGYTVRGVVVIPGEAYAKYGTSFPTLIAVIDKTGATAGPLLLHHSTGLPDAVEFLQSNGILDRPEPAARPAAVAPQPAGPARPNESASASGPRPGREVVGEHPAGERAGPVPSGEGVPAVRPPAVRPDVEPAVSPVSPGQAGEVSEPRPGGRPAEPAGGVTSTGAAATRPKRRQVVLRDLTEADLVPGTEVQCRTNGEWRGKITGSEDAAKGKLWIVEVTEQRKGVDRRPGRVLKYLTQTLFDGFQHVSDKVTGAGKPGVMPKSALPADTPAATPAAVQAPPPPPEAHEAQESAGYVPYSQSITEGRPHPGGIVETAGMAATPIPPVTARHKLKPETIQPSDPNKGISAMQLEFVLQAIQRHDIILPSNQRAGIMNGDGTGCVAAGTRIYNPITDEHTPIEVLMARGQPHVVLSLTPEGLQPRWAGVPFLKGVEDLYHVTMDSGKEIVVTSQHRFLTPSAWLRICDGLQPGCFLASVEDLPACNSVPSRLTRVEDGLHSWGTPEDCLVRCLPGQDPCDEPPLADRDTDQALLPSQDDAREHTLPLWRKDGLETLRGHSHLRPGADRHSRSGSSPAAIRDRVSSGYRSGAVGVLSPLHSNRDLPQFPEWEGGHQSSSGALRLLPDISSGCLFGSPYNHYSRWDCIKSIEFIRTDRYYDMHVPVTENYVAEGLVNHNTGKGRTNAAIIANNWSEGRRRSIWVSVSGNLIQQASKDLADIGYSEIPVHQLTDFPHGQDIDLPEGVIFTTYPGLIGTSEKKDAKVRWQQLVDWLGDDGVVIFDEAHRLQNMGSESVDAEGNVVQTGAASARAAASMQTALPKAYVVYSSATAMTDVEDMEFMSRLGLWGPGTAFPEGFPSFQMKIGTGGVGAMEQVANDMKAMGVYQARFLDFSDVKYEEDIYNLSADQRATYDAAARAWTTIGEKMNVAFEITNASAGKRRAIMRAYYGEFQSFMRSLITALKTDGVIERTRKEIAAGRSVIISLLGTGESTQKKNATKAVADGMSLDEMDFSPAQRMIAFIQRTFPIQNYREEEYTTAAGNSATRMVAVENPDGSPQINPRALEVQNALVDDVQDVRLPDNPIDVILNAFGHKNVAEMTGRKKRREMRNGKVELVNRRPERGSADKVNLEEMAAFQEGRKRIAITSKASSTGFSLHSDLSRKNHQQRVHILMELPWSADEAMQIFGRSHRTNQASAPIYVLASTDVGGERRFSSTIAKRLESLGALTRGSRAASGSGDALAKYNYESRYGAAAVDTLYNHLLSGQVPPGFPVSEGWTPLNALQRMGVYQQQQGGGEGIAESAEGNVKTLLNRVMFLQLDSQNPIFNTFHNFFEQIVSQAKSEGTFDDGMEDIKALAIRRTGAPVLLNTDRVTGTETKVFPLEIDTPHARIPLDYLPTKESATVAFVQNVKTGKVGFRRSQGMRKHGTRHEPGWLLSTPGEWSSGTVFAKDFEGDTPTWKVIEKGEARKLWDTELAALPAVHTRKTNMIVGTLLPIWNEMENALGDGVKVKRITADDGTRYKGVEINNARLENLKGALGVATGPVSPEAVYQQAWEDRATVLLARGARMLRTRVAGEDVIQIMGLDSATVRHLAEQGFPNTRMGLENRIWIPEGRMDLLGKLLDLFPAIGNSTRQQAPQEQQRAGLPVTVNTPLYHGTRAKFEGWPKESTAEQWGRAVYFATDPRMPREEYGGDGGRVIEARGDFQKPLYVPSSEYNRIVDQLASESHTEEQRLLDAMDAAETDAERKKALDDLDAFKPFMDGEPEGGAAISEQARKLGHDAIIQQHDEYGYEVAVLDTSRLRVPQQAIQIQQRAGKPATTEAPPPANAVEAFIERNEGAPRESDRRKLTDALEQLRDDWSRTYRHLPMSPQYAELRLFLNRLKAGRDIAAQDAMIQMAEVVRGLSRPEYNLFRSAIVVRDMMGQINRWQSLVAEGKAEGDWAGPEGLTEPEVLEAVDHVNAQLAENEKVREALARRAELQDRIKTTYSKAVTAVLGKPPKLDIEDYFHHQVFKYMQADRPRLKGTGQKVEAPTFRGFLRSRGFSEEAYNTAWIEAEHEVLAQMIYDTMVYKLLKYVERWDLKAQLKAQAAEQNEANFEAILQGMADAQNEEMEAEPDVPLVTVADIKKEVLPHRWKFAAGMDMLRRLARNDELPDTPSGTYAGLIAALKGDLPLTGAQMGQVMKYASWLLNQSHGKGTRLAAGMMFKATAAKQATMKAMLGKQRATWQNLMPKGHAEFYPKEGSAFFRAWTVPDHIKEELESGGAAALDVSKDDLRPVLALAGKQRSMVLPIELVNTLHAFNSSFQDSVEQDANKFRRKLMGSWKAYQLLNPKRFVGYNLRNEVGDLEASLFNPDGFRYLMQAALELAKFMGDPRLLRFIHSIEAKPGGKIVRAVDTEAEAGRVTPELREWLIRGGLMATLQAAEEVGTGAGIDLLAQFATRPDPFSREAWQQARTNQSYLSWANDARKRAWNHVWARLRGFTDFRESIARYAHYLSYLGQIERSPANLPDNFGASDPNAVLSMSDPRDRAYELSNRLIGAYDDVAEMGKLVAQNWIPFWRWHVVNYNRYKGIGQNVVREGRINVGRGGGAGGAGSGGGGGGTPPGGPGDFFADDDLPPWYNPRVCYRVGRKLAALAGIKTAGAAVGGLIALGAFVLKAGALYSGLWAWNHYRYGDDVINKIPEYDRGRPLLIVGYDDKTGRVLYFTRLGALQDIASWFGADNAMGYWEAWANGRLSLKDIAYKMLVEEPFSKIATSTGPITSFYETLTGRQLFPNALAPRPIRDKWEYLADSLSVGDLYRSMRHLPGKRNRWAQMLGAKEIMAGEAVYNEMFGYSRDYLVKQGKPSGGGGDTSEKIGALYNFKKAWKAGDVEAQERYLIAYAIAGGTDKGFESSMAAMDPLSGMASKDEKDFLSGLSMPDRRRLLDAYRWLGTLSPTTEMPTDAALKGEDFPSQVRLMRAAVRRAVKQENPVKGLKERRPDLKIGEKPAAVPERDTTGVAF